VLSGGLSQKEAAAQSDVRHLIPLVFGNGERELRFAAARRSGVNEDGDAFEMRERLFPQCGRCLRIGQIGGNACCAGLTRDRFSRRCIDIRYDRARTGASDGPRDSPADTRRRAGNQSALAA
jgi:hypothetical protein